MGWRRGMVRWRCCNFGVAVVADNPLVGWKQRRWVVWFQTEVVASIEATE